MSGDDTARSAFTRSAVLAPAEAALASAQLLLEQLRDQPGQAPAGADLARIAQAAGEMCALAKHPLTGAPEAAADELRTLRHDLKNRLNVVCGTCQLLLLDARDERLAAGVREIQHYAERCLEAVQAGALDAAAPAAAGAAGLDAIDDAGEAPAAVEPAHILVVDDQLENRETMARMLATGRHRVGFAANGLEALEALHRDDYDLVLLDILMPEMNGLQVLRELRRLGLLRHTPVIVVSGWDDRDNIIRCITAGAEDFISRPVDLRLLRARVEGSLERKRLRQRHFEQFFTPELARHFVRNPELLDRARSAEVSLLFADVRGFSLVSERLAAAPLCEWLQDVLGVLSDCVLEHAGVLVDYIGDELIAMWGAPGEQPDHALLACRAGRAMLARLPAVDARWSERIGGRTRIGVGINTGEAYVGNIGTARKLKYSALGNTVNLASRTQGASKYFRCAMLVTGATHARLGGAVPTRRLGRVRVANIEAPVEMFQVAPPDAADWHRLRDAYEEALAAFEAARFDAAISGLGRLLQDHPDDMPSLRLIRRAGEARYEPATRFDPVLVLPGK